VGQRTGSAIFRFDQAQGFFEGGPDSSVLPPPSNKKVAATTPERKVSVSLMMQMIAFLDAHQSHIQHPDKIHADQAHTDPGVG
jgi:hypothetical protein